MYRIISVLIAVSALFFSTNIQAQSRSKAKIELPNILFVITEAGDSLVASRILTSKTNEDQVTFIHKGKKKVLKANEVKSYYKKGRKVSVYIKSENQRKLIKIAPKGAVKLGGSTSSKRKEKFYLSVDGEWINLEPYKWSLKENLSRLIPDFEKVVEARKIHYNFPSLGKAISQYNDYKDPKSKMTGVFRYSQRAKIGVMGHIGLSTISIDEYATNFGTSLSTNFGLAAQIQYSRLFALRVQAGYVSTTWTDEAWDIKLRTVSLAPLFDVQFYNQKDIIKLSAAFGFNVNLDLNSDITNLQLNIESASLSWLDLGYNLQLHSAIGDHLGVFVSYQIIPNQKTKKMESVSINDKSFGFNTNQLGVGAVFYF